MQGIRPSILLVEEAGQVLEAHVLGSLVQSIEHVIMIGDPLQLRPTISNYGMLCLFQRVSTDSPQASLWTIQGERRFTNSTSQLWKG